MVLRRPRMWAWVVVALLAPVLVVFVTNATRSGSRVAAQSTTPTATCGPGDVPEPGLQGRVPPDVQAAGFDGFRCGLRLVGQNTIKNRGGNHQIATLGACAYVTTTALAGSDPAYPDTGMAVIDASDPTNPTLVQIVRSPGTLETLEALHAYSGIITAATGNIMDTFDATADCRYPVLKSSFTLPVATHGFRLSDDGKTAYALGHGALNAFQKRYLVAVDVSNPSAPKLLLEYPDYGGHDMDLSPDGNRAYIAGESGLIILDTSDIQSRKANPQIRLVKKITWPSGASVTSHTAKWVQRNGRTYILASNEAFGPDCTGRPQARHIDITDENNPVQVAEYWLQVNDPQTCLANNVAGDGLSYNVHYIGVDDKFDTRMVFWNWFAAGVRVFDFADPAKPKEIAYYNPPVKTDVAQQGGLFANERAFVDISTPYMWYKPETGHLWMGSVSNGFQILQFTQHVRQLHSLPPISGAPAPVLPPPPANPPLAVPPGVVPPAVSGQPTLTGITPVRLFDTRPTEPQGMMPVTQERIGAGKFIEVHAVNMGEIPATGVSALSMNVTVVDPGGDGFVTAFPCSARPLAANLNYVRGQTVSNAVVAPVSASGRVCFYTHADTHLVADVNGWFAADEGYAPRMPLRLVDTRPTEPQGVIPVVQRRYGGANELRVKVTGEHTPETGVTAVALNVTAVDPAGDGYVTVYPCGQRPLAAHVTYHRGRNVPGAVIAPVSSTGEICLHSHVDTHLVIDLDGWFGQGSDHSSLSPTRLFDTRPTERQGAANVAQQRYGGGTVLRVKVTGVAGLPAAGVEVVALTVTTVDSLGPGFVTTFECGTRPLAADLTHAAGQRVSNAVLAPVSSTGEICLYSHAPTHLVADVNGWFAST